MLADVAELTAPDGGAQAIELELNCCSRRTEQKRRRGTSARKTLDGSRSRFREGHENDAEGRGRAQNDTEGAGQATPSALCELMSSP
eukprot:CAMPEP_0170162548 /NCGR_PEP_ID=MMETSP0033_2-20121228/77133_1 /TAXON_ID=195969 /ORGANISM="Dolichomastix tenuilepis, Strain CCMP3274" /LENGTH=86 /DNA_ID=CAMNT_0010400175 /DNA_START=569 /DNA_END=829 /DNA_ORIENTATION=+